MKVYIGIAKRRLKGLSAAAVAHEEDLGVWHVFLYGVLGNKAAPFAEDAFDTREEAFDHACETLKIKPQELVETDEEHTEDYILKHALHKWPLA